MRQDEFRTLAESWGGDLTRWPPEKQAAAVVFAATPEGAAILAAERRLDELIAAATPAVSSDRAFRAIDTVLAQTRTPTPARRSWRKLLDGWMMPAAGLAGAAAAGLALGMINPVPLQGTENGPVLSMIFDVNSIPQRWITQ